MLPGVAPRVISVNNKPSPCHCTDKVICSYCVQANMVLWEREERERLRGMPDPLIAEVKRRGLRMTSRLMGVDHKTVRKWVKTSMIPKRYKEKLHRVLGTPIGDHT